MTSGKPSGLLAGVKVVEFSQNAAVPQCGRLLAGMGAEVVKVEPPEGDAMRHLAALAPNEGRAYATINPGKRAIRLDLGTENGRDVADRLIRWADIVLIGLKRVDFERYGLDWDRVRAVNPSVVSLEFTAFGPEGPEAERPGYDQLVQAASGLGWPINRSADGVPLPTRPAIVDFSSGGVAATAVLAALRHAERTGEGLRVDASLLGTAMMLGTPMMASFEPDRERVAQLREDLALMRQAGVGFDDQRELYESRVVAMGGLFKLYVRPYRTADGLVSIAGYSPGLKSRFHEVTGLPEPPTTAIGDDPELLAVVAEAEALFASRTTDEWLEELISIGYPCSRYNTPHEAIEQPQVEANDYVVDLTHELYGPYRTVGMPFSFSDHPTVITEPAPAFDQHTEEVLAELGYSPEQVAAIRGD